MGGNSEDDNNKKLRIVVMGCYTRPGFNMEYELTKNENFLLSFVTTRSWLLHVVVRGKTRWSTRFRT